MELQVRTKFWIERDGKIALSGRRLELLEFIAVTGSLMEASRRMGWPYRRAWEKVREMERNLGVRLIETESGGHGGGGGSRLTPAALDFIRRYREFAAGAEAAVAEQFRRAFGPDAASDAASDAARPRR